MWFGLPWKNFQKKTFRLQRRIYKASKDNDTARMHALQIILFTSYEARMLAIRQITQLNNGKKTAGIDGKSNLTMAQRFELEKELAKSAKKWKHKGLRNVTIPKPDGTTRPLKIPTIRDRAWQCLAKLTLEPAHEANFHPRSYGFRPGRCTQDAQKVIFSSLNSKNNGMIKRILELDIEKCFDRINHKLILDNLKSPSFLKERLSYCLKIGTPVEFPDQGTPQGGVVSSLLANIALNGIEQIHPCIRYADHMIFFLKPQDCEKELLQKISTFLATRGLNINNKKTYITAATNGFNFLGWHFKVLKNGKFNCSPSKDNYANLKKKVKAIVNNSAYGTNTKASNLAPIIRGWRNYHKYCDMSKHTLWELNHSTWKVFIKDPKLNVAKANELIKEAFPKVSYSANRFVNVKLDKSPFDGDIIYWSKRNSKFYDGLTVTVLNKQSHTCKYCGLIFLGDQQVHLHHIDGNHSNWKLNNLMAIHRACHGIIHHVTNKGKGGNNPN